MNKPITSALIALGLVSAASAVFADQTGVTINGVTGYTEVFITGSTAARANVFNAVNTAHSSGGLFDSVPSYVTPSAGVTGYVYPGAVPNGSSGAYTAYGTIGGVKYCLCFSWTGSEAGLYAIQHNSGGGLSNPVLAGTLAGNPAYPNAVIPGTPTPTTFTDPNTGAYITSGDAADLSMADTSQAVSLSQSPTLTDYGIVGAITFVWCKGKNSSPDTDYNDLVNVEDYQMFYLMGGPVTASYLTGNTLDSDLVFCTGRNRASGTHQNTELVAGRSTTQGVDQWVANDATYSTAGVLTVGTGNSLSTVGGIDEVFNDGYDSGGGVASTLKYDETGSQNAQSQGSSVYTGNLILIGYVGISDANTATAGGAKELTFNGFAENDATVETGTYPFWGHEHLYGEVTEDSAVQAIGHALAGSTAIESFGSGAPNGALENGGGLGGGEANLAGTQSTIISPEYMSVDKPSGGDAGYPLP